MKTPTAEQLDKLPKWAKDWIDSLARERHNALGALNKWVDEQTPSPVFVDELESLGEDVGPSFKRHYFQTERIRCEWQGIGLDIDLQDDGIRLQWAGTRRELSDIALIPQTFQQVKLIAKENMR